MAGSRLDRVLQWTLRPLIVLGVGTLFAESFWQSWATLRKAATQAGVAHPDTWPWQVDGFILVMALIVLDAIRSRGGGWGGWRGRIGVWWARAGLVSATGVSTVVQYVYAPDGAGWMHALNAPAVLFSFECLTWLLYGSGSTPPAGAARMAEGEEREQGGVRRGGSPIPVPGSVSAAGAAGTPSSSGSNPRAAGSGPAAPPHDEPAATPGTSTGAGTQPTTAGVARGGRSLPDPPVRVEDLPVTMPSQLPVPLARRERAERKRLYERLRHDYRAGVAAADAATARGVPLDDVARVYGEYAGRYGPQPGLGNGDRPVGAPR